MATKALVAATTKQLILSYLRHGKSYGYEIIKNIEELSGGELAWTDAMLYPVLHRMERDQLLKSDWVKLPSGRKRKYYEITEQGKEEALEDQRQWQKVNDTLNLLWGSNPKLQLG